MKITAVRIRKLRGTMAVDGKLWEDRLVRPIDVYEEYRSTQRRDELEGGIQLDDHRFQVDACFLQVETDQGVIGIAGPITEAVGGIVARSLRWPSRRSIRRTRNTWRSGT